MIISLYKAIKVTSQRCLASVENSKLFVRKRKIETSLRSYKKKQGKLDPKRFILMLKFRMIFKQRRRYLACLLREIYTLDLELVKVFSPAQFQFVRTLDIHTLNKYLRFRLDFIVTENKQFRICGENIQTKTSFLETEYMSDNDSL